MINNINKNTLIKETKNKKNKKEKTKNVIMKLLKIFSTFSPKLSLKKLCIYLNFSENSEKKVSNKKMNNNNNNFNIKDHLSDLDTTILIIYLLIILLIIEVLLVVLSTMDLLEDPQDLCTTKILGSSNKDLLIIITINNILDSCLEILRCGGDTNNKNNMNNNNSKKINSNNKINKKMLENILINLEDSQVLVVLQRENANLRNSKNI